MNEAQRKDFYAKKTGLSKADIKRYRDAPVGSWTKRADRKIGSTLRFLDRLANDTDLSWDDWRKQGAVLLKAVHQWVHGMLDTIAEFVERIAAAAEKVLVALRKILVSLEPYAPLIVALFARRLAGSQAT